MVTAVNSAKATARRVGWGGMPPPPDQGVAAVGDRGERREGNGAAVEMREIAAATQREEKNAGRQADDAGPAGQVEVLAEQDRAARRGHQRRGAARDRVDLPHVAGAI